MARAKWVALQSEEAITRAELAELLRVAYQLVFRKLAKRVQAEMRSKPPVKKMGEKKAIGKSSRSKKN
jgi:hypothetical protein